jgi:SAM-dependent methyltransferase
VAKARAVADERGLKNVEFAVADVHALDFPDDSFDVVHAHQVLQHVGDPVQALREMKRGVPPRRCGGRPGQRLRGLHLVPRAVGVGPCRPRSATRPGIRGPAHSPCAMIGV